MISAVTFEKTTYQAPPHRFEAGTPAIAEAVGLAAAIRYLDALDFSVVVRLEHEQLAYATSALSSILTTSPRFSIAKASRFEPGITAASP